MDIRQITPEFAVAPQIQPAELAELVAMGFTTLINNRPDEEVPPELKSSAMKAAAEAAGLTYVENPVINGAMTMDMVTAQGEVVAASGGPVFAYCRSGTRSAIVWALSQAGKQPVDNILGVLAKAGYDMGGMRGQIEMLVKC